jgi:hypothetical protein
MVKMTEAERRADLDGMFASLARDPNLWHETMFKGAFRSSHVDALLAACTDRDVVRGRIVDFYRNYLVAPSEQADADVLLELAEHHVRACLPMLDRDSDTWRREFIEQGRLVLTAPVEFDASSPDGFDPARWWMVEDGLGADPDPRIRGTLDDVIGSSTRRLDSVADVGWTFVQDGLHELTLHWDRAPDPILLVQYMLDPVYDYTMDVSSYYELWKLGASLWWRGDHIAVCPTGAYRWSPEGRDYFQD